MRFPTIRFLVFILVNELIAAPLALFVLQSRPLFLLIHLGVLARLTWWVVADHLRRQQKKAAEHNEATSMFAVSFRTPLGLGQLLESVRSARDYEWTEGQKTGFGKYLRGTGKGATLKILPCQKRYVLEIEFPLDGVIKPSGRQEMFAAVQQDLLPLLEAEWVRDETAAAP
jgi:hypothetical protein